MAPGESVSSVDIRLSKLDSKINRLLDKFQRFEDFQKNFEEFKQSMDFVNLQYEEIKLRFDPIEGELKSLRKELDELKMDKVAMVRENAELRSSVEGQVNLQRSAMLELAGVPFRNEEIPKDLVLKISDKVNAGISASDVKCAFRKGKKDNKDGYVFVEFTSKGKRDGFFDKAKKARLTGIRLGFTGVHTPIYINESLTYFTRNLLFKARNFKKENGWMFAWVKDGKVFVKKDENSRGIRIGSSVDLAALVLP